ncbi:hypothetical protein WJX74_006138 [Apatococcus lobatus]|uniref:IQ calmodulin-binding motif family protein n=1 Tax=Apatococcus lobatus TaxID=904363 RepID=A0AAW1SEQ1_9CHLO
MPSPTSTRPGGREPTQDEGQAMRHFQGNAMQHIRDKLQKLRMDANARSALERRVKKYLVEQQEQMRNLDIVQDNAKAAMQATKPNLHRHRRKVAQRDQKMHERAHERKIVHWEAVLEHKRQETNRGARIKAEAQAARLAAEAAAAEAERSAMEAARQDLMARITLTQRGLMAETDAIRAATRAFEAVIAIQARWRASCGRRRFQTLKAAVISVQRIFRRYTMDPVRREARRQRAAKLLLSFFRELYRRKEFAKRAEYLCQQLADGKVHVKALLEIRKAQVTLLGLQWADVDAKAAAKKKGKGKKKGKAARASEVKMSAEDFMTAGFMMDGPGASATDAALDEGIRQRVLWAFLQIKQQDLCKGLGLHWRAIAKRQASMSQPKDPSAEEQQSDDEVLLRPRFRVLATEAELAVLVQQTGFETKLEALQAQEAAKARKLEEAAREAEKVLQGEAPVENGAEPSMPSHQMPADRRASESAQAAVPPLTLQYNAASEGAPSKDRIMPQSPSETVSVQPLAAPPVGPIVPDAAKLAQTLEWLRIRFQRVTA